MDSLCVATLVLFLAAFGQALPPRKGLTIIGGHTTDIRKVPYQVALLVGTDELACGGSILSDRFVLTAAHCCSDFLPAKIRTGSNNFDRGGVVIDVKRCVIHPKYQNLYDMAIVELESPIPFSDRSRPIKIGKFKPPPDSVVSVAGWGLTNENGSLSNQLMSVDVPVTNDTYCHKAYPDINDMSLVVCAGVKGKDSCQGDSGGGLTFNGELIGLVSFGLGCGLQGYPGVYTSTTQHELRQFIHDVAGV